jgi:hypothetical protein
MFVVNSFIVVYMFYKLYTNTSIQSARPHTHLLSCPLFNSPPPLSSCLLPIYPILLLFSPVPLSSLLLIPSIIVSSHSYPPFPTLSSPPLSYSPPLFSVSPFSSSSSFIILSSLLHSHPLNHSIVSPLGFSLDGRVIEGGASLNNNFTYSFSDFLFRCRYCY